MVLISAAACIIVVGASLYIAALARQVTLRFYEVCDMTIRRFDLEKTSGKVPLPMGRLTQRERMERAAKTIAFLREQEEKANQ